MRLPNWILAIGAALFISGIGFILVGAQTARRTPRAPAAPAGVPVATIKQIMNGIVAPASAVVYQAVGTIVSEKGVEEIAPKTEEEWATVGNNAAAVAEAGNLLMLGSRAIDTGDWVAMSRALTVAAKKAVTAAAAKDTDGILSSGEEINAACDACHARYQRQ